MASTSYSTLGTSNVLGRIASKPDAVSVFSRICRASPTPWKRSSRPSVARRAHLRPSLPDRPSATRRDPFLQQVQGIIDGSAPRSTPRSSRSATASSLGRSMSAVHDPDQRPSSACSRRPSDPNQIAESRRRSGPRGRWWATRRHEALGSHERADRQPVVDSSRAGGARRRSGSALQARRAD